MITWVQLLPLQGDLTKQEFLQGHSNRVSALAMSKSGKYLASGQVSPMGFSAPIIVWDYAGRKILHKLILHKVCCYSACNYQSWYATQYKMILSNISVTHKIYIQTTAFLLTLINIGQWVQCTISGEDSRAWLLFRRRVAHLIWGDRWLQACRLANQNRSILLDCN